VAPDLQPGQYIRKRRQRARSEFGRVPSPKAEGHGGRPPDRGPVAGVKSREGARGPYKYGMKPRTLIPRLDILGVAYYQGAIPAGGLNRK